MILLTLATMCCYFFPFSFLSFPFYCDRGDVLSLLLPSTNKQENRQAQKLRPYRVLLSSCFFFLYVPLNTLSMHLHNFTPHKSVAFLLLVNLKKLQNLLCFLPRTIVRISPVLNSLLMEVSHKSKLTLFYAFF